MRTLNEESETTYEVRWEPFQLQQAGASRLSGGKIRCASPAEAKKRYDQLRDPTSDLRKDFRNAPTSVGIYEVVTIERFIDPDTI